MWLKVLKNPISPQKWLSRTSQADASYFVMVTFQMAHESSWEEAHKIYRYDWDLYVIYFLSGYIMFVT